MSEAQIPANPLGTERIGKLLRGFAIPGIISMVINSLYNMVDQVFIGQGVGMLGNGATNIISPISTFAIALSSLFGDGLATYFSLQLGKGEPEKASKAVGTAITAGTGVSAVLTAVVLAFLEPLCRIFGATDAILPYGHDAEPAASSGATGHGQDPGLRFRQAIRTDFAGPGYLDRPVWRSGQAAGRDDL